MEQLNNTDTNISNITSILSNHAKQHQNKQCCGTTNIHQLNNIISEDAKNERSNQYNPQYIYKNSFELQVLLEKEFEEIMSEVRLIYDNNQEMMAYDPNDYDLLQAIEDNLVIINKRLVILKQIQSKLKQFAPNSVFTEIDIMKVFDDNGVHIESYISSIINEKVNDINLNEKDKNIKQINPTNTISNPITNITNISIENKDDKTEFDNFGGMDDDEDELKGNDKCLQEIEL